MGYPSLQACITDLEKNGHLIRIKDEVDPYLQMAAIHLRVFEHGGPAILFENVTGSKFPAVSNLFGTLERSKFIFRDTLDQIKTLIELKNDPLKAVKHPFKYAHVGLGSAGMAVALAVGLASSGSLGAAEAEAFPVDSPQWQLSPTASVSEYLGRRCLALVDGSATLRDFEMIDGVIDVDMAGNGDRGFYNIAFRRQSDEEMEVVYLRPHKTGLDDAQQYTPVFRGSGAWQIYNGPGFTAAVDIPRDVWFHVRLVIAGAQAQLYVGNMAVPSLVMNDLKSGIRQGGVGFYGVHVSNVEIRKTPPAVWVRHEPSMRPATIVKWTLSPSMDALDRDLERPLAKSEADSMNWQEVTAEPPGFVVINRYRKVPEIIPTFARDFSKRLEPQKGMQLVYARTTIVSDRDRITKLYIGYSDDVTLFLNDRILYRGRSAQRFRDPGFLGIVNAENDAVYLPLKKGRNELVLAVSELTGGWGFICQFGDMAGIQ